MKGISPFVAAVLLIVVVVAAGGIISMWYTSLTKQQAQYVTERTEEAVECQYGGIRILTETIKCDFSGNGTATNPEYLNFSVENSGSINLYDLKVIVYLNGISYNFPVYEALTNLTFTENYPLRPDEIKTVVANITQDLPLADADWIRLITNCPQVNSGNIEDIDCTP